MQIASLSCLIFLSFYLITIALLCFILRFNGKSGFHTSNFLLQSLLMPSKVQILHVQPDRTFNSLSFTPGPWQLGLTDKGMLESIRVTTSLSQFHYSTITLRPLRQWPGLTQSLYSSTGLIRNSTSNELLVSSIFRSPPSCYPCAMATCTSNHRVRDGNTRIQP
ncbi:hypothetical protein BGZ63DRAFT_391560 [Mariannaea sp. PMI_226]|nr:hypothetical protein BGZ63DRAFT_391560 [Mariannaea sp. PMI_226]